MMKFKKSLKKGFTLVELIVVIAIIAILAAVSVVSYIAFINQANKSSDEQAVSQINTVLSASDANNKPSTLADVISDLAKQGFDVKDYKPLLKDTYFYWDSSINRVLIADNNNVVKFPADLVGNSKANYAAGKWYSLSGLISGDSSWKNNISGNEVTISSGKQLYSFISAIDSKEYSSNDSTVVKLCSGSIDMMGGLFNLSSFKGSIEGSVDSEGKPTTELNGVRSDRNTTVGQNAGGSQLYYMGMIGNVSSAVTIKNLNIENPVCYYDMTISNKSLNIAGLLVGAVNNGGDLLIENVHITNAKVRASYKVGGMVGTIQGTGKVKISNSSIASSNIQADQAYAAGLVGSVRNNGLTLVNTTVADDVVVETLKNTKELYNGKEYTYTYFSNVSESAQDITINGEAYTTTPLAIKGEYMCDGTYCYVGQSKYYSACFGLSTSIEAKIANKPYRFDAFCVAVNDLTKTLVSDYYVAK